MPTLENKPDRRGCPICPKCAQPILPGDGVALMEDFMIHADCVSAPVFGWCYPDRAVARTHRPHPVTGAVAVKEYGSGRACEPTRLKKDGP